MSSTSALSWTGVIKSARLRTNATVLNRPRTQVWRCPSFMRRTSYRRASPEWLSGALLEPPSTEATRRVPWITPRSRWAERRLILNFVWCHKISRAILANEGHRRDPKQSRIQGEKTLFSTDAFIRAEWIVGQTRAEFHPWGAWRGSGVQIPLSPPPSPCLWRFSAQAAE